MRVDERIELDKVILSLIFWNCILFAEAFELFDIGFISFDLDDQQEGAAFLESVLWFTSGENEQLVFVDKGGLDVEVVDVNILLTKPLPFSFEIFTSLCDSLVDSAANLEAGLIKVSLNENGDRLILLVLNIDLLSNQMECWKFTGFGPCVWFEVKHSRLFFFGATDEKNLSDLIIDLLWWNTWSCHLFWRFLKRLEFGVFSFDDGHFESFLEYHCVLQWEDQVLEFGELDDVLRQNITILLHNTLVFVFIILP